MLGLLREAAMQHSVYPDPHSDFGDFHCDLSWQRFHFCFDTRHSPLWSQWAAL
jgi:hypothetical protein